MEKGFLYNWRFQVGGQSRCKKVPKVNIVNYKMNSVEKFRIAANFQFSLPGVIKKLAKVKEGRKGEKLRSLIIDYSW